MSRAPAVAVILGVAAMLVSCGGSRPPRRREPDQTSSSTTPAPTAAAATHPDLGPFAGYVWNGDVHDAHASWAVPRVLPGSVRGEAATWIGAEAPGPARAAPFVQVGVNEGNTANQPFYYAFYSTTQLHFHPVHLFDVSPGDQISATLTRQGSGWRIAFVDHTAGRERRLSVTEGAGQRFNEAQYTQEDVTDARTGQPFPYPSLSSVRFTAIAANGVAPRPSRLTSNWLTEADGYLAPAPLHGDGFALAHAQMSAADLRYLRAIAAEDNAAAAATPPLLRWEQGGPARLAGRATRPFARVLRATLSAVDDQRWPAPARPAISAVRAHAGALLALLSRIAGVTPVGRFAWAEQFVQLAEQVGDDGQRARRALGLPSPLTPRAQRQRFHRSGDHG